MDTLDNNNEVLNKEPIEVVIWDVDGTMFNSELAYFEAQKSLAKRLTGYDFTEEDQKQLTGAGEVAMERFARIIGLSEKKIYDEVYMERLLQLRDKFFVRKLIGLGDRQKMPGLDDLFNVLKAMGVRQAISTTASRSQLEALFEAVDGIDLDDFEVVGTGDDLATIVEEDRAEYGIGDEGYAGDKVPINRLVLDGLNIDPSYCMIMEDTPKGVDAAEKAGIGLVFAVPNNLTEYAVAEGGFRKASYIARDLYEIVELIDKDCIVFSHVDG